MHALRTPELGAPPLVRYGNPEYVRRDNPAAGAEFTEALGGKFRVRLLTLFVRLVTDANAANRQLRLEYRDDADRVYYVSTPPVTFPASETHDYSFSAWQGQADWTGLLPVVLPLAPMLLPPTHDFHIEVNNIQVTDQLSLISFWWERFYAEDPGN